MYQAYKTPIDNTTFKVEWEKLTDQKWVKLPGFNEYFLGPYSEKKNRLICEQFNLTLLDFLEPMSTVKIRTLGIKFDQYLKEMEALPKACRICSP